MSVHRVRLIKELLGALSKIYLIHASNFGVECVDVLSLLRHSESLDGVFLARFFLLEVALHLQNLKEVDFLHVKAHLEYLAQAVVTWSDCSKFGFDLIVDFLV